VELHSFEAGPDAGVNLILKLAGQNPELEPIWVAAHYVGPLNSPGEEMRALFGDRGDFIALVANNEAAHLLPALSTMNHHVPTKALPVPLRGEEMPSVRLSDHSPFWDQGYNAMMVTDTSFLRNPHDHEPTDTIATLDLPFLMAVIDGLELALGGLV
jgi:hypothetical protein